MANRFLRPGSWIALGALLSLSMPAPADIVVIVNTGSSIEQLSRDDVVNIFMGRYRKLPDGTSVTPLDIKGDAPLRKAFYKALLDKSLPEINAYWARLIFSGRTLPPVMLDNIDQIVDTVAHDSSVIGFARNGRLEEGVKIVYRMPDPLMQ